MRSAFIRVAESDHSNDELHGAKTENVEMDEKEEDTQPFSIQEELRKADEKAKKTAKLIKNMKETINTYQAMTELSFDDERNLQLRQEELLEKLREFETITQRVQGLVGRKDDRVDLTSLIDNSADCSEEDEFRLHCDDDRLPFDPHAEITLDTDCKLRITDLDDQTLADDDHHLEGTKMNCQGRHNSTGAPCERGSTPSDANVYNNECTEVADDSCSNQRREVALRNETPSIALNQMECQLQDIQQELAQVQKEREVLECQRRVLKSFANETPYIPGKSSKCGMRTDQLSKLQEDLDNKISENQSLHAQVERLKAAIEATQRGMDNWEARACELEQKLRCLELHKNRMADSKIKQMELEQQNQLSANKCRELQEELEELRVLVDDQAGHLECYRNKYLLAQQQVEEQKRQIEQLEGEQGRIGEQVQIEVQRIKAQFQERLQELSPLPDLLKCVQAKLQEAQQLRLIAENNCEDLSRDLQTLCDKNAESEAQICKLRTGTQQLMEERTTLRAHLETYEMKFNKLKDEINKYKQCICQMEESSSATEKTLEEKQLECARLRAEIESVRDDAARQSARCRERYETMRRALQCQVSDLEQELVCSRAAAAAASRDRDEVQQKLQAQINHITQSFGQTQDRIKNLQNVVDVLRTNVMNTEGHGSLPQQQSCEDRRTSYA